MRKFSRYIVFVFLALLLFVPTESTSACRCSMTFKETIDSADIVIAGTVRHTEYESNSKALTAYIDVKRVWKGPVFLTIPVQHYGCGGMTLLANKEDYLIAAYWVGDSFVSSFCSSGLLKYVSQEQLDILGQGIDPVVYWNRILSWVAIALASIITVAMGIKIGKRKGWFGHFVKRDNL